MDRISNFEIVRPFWRRRPEALAFEAGTAEVWRVGLSADPGRWTPHLLPEEIARLSRFRVEADARREATGRGALRWLLGRYLGILPRDAGITTGPGGKPEMAGQPGERRMRFNLSHSGDWVVLAFARASEIGIDVEQWRDVQLEEIGHSAFAPEEVAEWRRMPEDRRVAGFFGRWTAKEAYLKALGVGLSQDPRRIRVALDADLEPELAGGADGEAKAGARWKLIRLDVAPGYSAALAVERESVHRVCTYALD